MVRLLQQRSGFERCLLFLEQEGLCGPAQSVESLRHLHGTGVISDGAAKSFCLGRRSTWPPRSRRDVRPCLQHVGHFLLVGGEPRWCRVGCDQRTHVRLRWFLTPPRLAFSVPGLFRPTVGVLADFAADVTKTSRTRCGRGWRSAPCLRW